MRSVRERALEVDYKNHTLWLKYAEVEMKNKFVNHARNVWDRMVTLLPRVDQLWYKYIHMEKMLEERWKEAERARCIYKFALDHIPKGRAEDLYASLLHLKNSMVTGKGLRMLLLGREGFSMKMK